MNYVFNSYFIINVVMFFVWFFLYYWVIFVEGKILKCCCIKVILRGNLSNFSVLILDKEYIGIILEF